MKDAQRGIKRVSVILLSLVLSLAALVFIAGCAIGPLIEHINIGGPQILCDESNAGSKRCDTHNISVQTCSLASDTYVWITTETCPADEASDRICKLTSSTTAECVSGGCVYKTVGGEYYGAQVGQKGCDGNLLVQCLSPPDEEVTDCSNDPSRPYCYGDSCVPCKDTDDGKDYYAIGTVYAANTPQGAEDWCDVDTGKLIEQYCGDDNLNNADWYDCPNGCQNGACLPNVSYINKTLYNCIDSDGGKNFTVKGTCTDSRNISFTDSCNPSVPGSINEAFCENQNCNFVAFDVLCKNGCEDGACVSGEGCGDGVCTANEVNICPQDCLVCEQDSDCNDNNEQTVEFCREIILCPVGEVCGSTCKFIRLSDISCEQVYGGNAGNAEKKINLVFISNGYFFDNNKKIVEDAPFIFQVLNPYGIESRTCPKALISTNMDDFDKFVEYQLDENGIGLFGTEPYKSYKNKFNVYKLSSEIDWRRLLPRINVDFTYIIDIIQKKCGTSEGTIMGNIVENEIKGFSYGYFPISTTTIFKTTPVHEMGGHSINACYDSSSDEYAALQDEYFQYNFVFESTIFRSGTTPSAWLNEKFNQIHSINMKCNIDTEGCPKWCDGTLNSSKFCYPYYVEWKDCVIDSAEGWEGSMEDWFFGSFKDCWEDEAYKYFQETGMSLEECELGSNCMEGTDCVWPKGNSFFLFAQTKNDLMNQKDYAYGFEKPNPERGVYYTSPTEVPPVPEAERAEIIAKPCAPIGGDMEGISPASGGIEWRCSYTPESGLMDKMWWTVKWEHLDTEGCPKWCDGLDINNECYPYYVEFKECAEDLFSDSNNIKLGLNRFVDAESCWDSVSNDYYLATGKDLKDGCSLGLNCREEAECVWPGGGHWNPYATFRKNKEFPYWGYGVYSQQLIKAKIENLTS